MPANVNQSTFGKLFVIGVDGKVDAQPLYVPSVAIPGQSWHNVLYVVTEHDSAYAFDADTGTQLWHVSLLGTNETPSDDRGCGQVTPEIGITATPAIDPQSGPHGTLYAVAMSKDGSGNYHQRLHALDLTTGAEELGGPVEIQATYLGSGDEGTGNVQTFDPKQHKERAALLSLNGVVYTSWSSHCDFFPYTAWVIGYSETTLARVNVLNLTPNGSDGSVWGAGAGPAADAAGNLYLLMANGTFDTTLNATGFPVNDDYGNAFVKLSTAGGTLSVADYFTMSNTVSESNADQDLGSGGAMVLPPLNDSQGHSRALAVGAGKDLHIYVVDRNNLGKFNPNTNAIYQDLNQSLPGGVGVFSSPAWFNGKLYYGAVGDTLKAFAFANGMFGTTPASHSTTVFGYPGTTPSISANGTSNGIVWAAENGSTAVLHAYDATDLSKEFYNSNQAANQRDNFGAGNKFIVPTVVNGKVYVGTTNGVGVFGLLCSYAIAPQSVTVDAIGGTGTISVPATGGCAWSARSNAAWLTITAGGSGIGIGAVGYSISANPSSVQRQGTLTIAGQTFTVTQTGNMTPDKVGVFNPAQAAFLFDANGNFLWDGSSTDRYFTLGSSSAIPVVGDWNGNGRQKVGVFDPATATWFLDMNGNGVWDGSGIDRIMQWGSPGDVPVVGDWNGSGTTKIGVFSPGTALWLLDYNGNFVWDGAGIDRYFSWGSPNDKPAVGDWNGSGTTKVGVFNSGQGFWVLDYNGNFVWDGTDTDKFFRWGSPNDTPVVGDWNGSGTAKVGVYNSAQAVFLLDYNGNFVWDGAATDRYFSWGSSGDQPVLGDWNASGTTKVGVFNTGAALWLLDYNGNFVWDGAAMDSFFLWGSPGNTPLVGRW